MDAQPLSDSNGARRAIAAAIAASALVAAGLWWMLGEDVEPQAEAVASTLTPVVMEQPRVEPAAAAASAVATEARADVPGEMQMCGGAWVKLQDDGDVDWKSVAAVSRDANEALANRVLAAMAGSADEQARAAALSIAAPVSPVPTATARDAGARRDALAQLAQDSSDPVVYGWAVQACSVATRDATGFCQVISASQWARLDPSNAAPWIAVAAGAQAEHDTVAFADALFRISVAERYDPGEQGRAALLLDHVPAGDDNLWGAWTLAGIGSGIGSAFAAADAQALNGFCRGADLAEGGRRDVCDRIAEMLVKASTTTLGLNAGRAIGRRVGWPDERLEQLESESRALEAMLAVRRDAESLACGRLHAQLDALREFAEQGQVPVLRRRFARSAGTLASASPR